MTNGQKELNGENYWGQKGLQAKLHHTFYIVGALSSKMFNGYRRYQNETAVRYNIHIVLDIIRVTTELRNLPDGA